MLEYLFGAGFSTANEAIQLELPDNYYSDGTNVYRRDPTYQMEFAVFRTASVKKAVIVYHGSNVEDFTIPNIAYLLMKSNGLGFASTYYGQTGSTLLWRKDVVQLWKASSRTISFLTQSGKFYHDVQYLKDSQDRKKWVANWKGQLSLDKNYYKDQPRHGHYYLTSDGSQHHDDDPVPYNFPQGVWAFQECGDKHVVLSRDNSLHVLV